jgi:hypothetical protein
MTSTTTRSSIVACQRTLRGWFGISLMVVSLLGGYRVTARVTEETNSEEIAEVQAYAHRQAEGSALKRRPRTENDGWVTTHHFHGAVSVPRTATRESGERPPAGHLIANGLRAPLRC